MQLRPLLLTHDFILHLFITQLQYLIGIFKGCCLISRIWINLHYHIQSGRMLDVFDIRWWWWWLDFCLPITSYEHHCAKRAIEIDIKWKRIHIKYHTNGMTFC